MIGIFPDILHLIVDAFIHIIWISRMYFCKVFLFVVVDDMVLQTSTAYNSTAFHRDIRSVTAEDYIAKHALPTRVCVSIGLLRLSPTVGYSPIQGRRSLWDRGDMSPNILEMMSFRMSTRVTATVVCCILMQILCVVSQKSFSFWGTSVPQTPVFLYVPPIIL